ncbi:YchJ family protein [Oceanicoccus sp. KOV_DT_Chl]|uniref:YchJ family protein n=1 Tax=Oceanicoccus sp. KOV_DT_Chl TaxID=1904639 RepID=UPI000C7C7059|nr:YchJ family metal-binding protein [Oceanicoccus sp. KOV_DT_Chl]
MPTFNNCCHCDLPQPFEQCCEPIIKGLHTATTAEQLMRSRFSAFCTGNIDYLIASHHPSKRHANDQQELANTIALCEWLQLKIVRCNQGAVTDSHGEVEFIATYTQQGKLATLHENSRFVQEDNQWFYLDGDILESNHQFKPGRNDPCFCGSGKKFKKCCSDKSA